MVYSLQFDDQGNLWTGTRKHELIKIEFSRSGQPTQFLNYTFKTGNNPGMVSDIMIDQQQNIWFTSMDLSLNPNGGVCQLAGDQYHFIGKEQGLIHEDVWSIAQDKEGTLWFGTWGEGLTKYRPSKQAGTKANICLLYTSPSPRDGLLSRMPSSA